jgi:hypothetical protein
MPQIEIDRHTPLEMGRRVTKRVTAMARGDGEENM